MSEHPICSCDGFPFIYHPAGNIVTGHVSIVGRNVLEDLLTKGPKYREPRYFSWNKYFNSIMNAVENYSKKWPKKECVDDSALSEWVNVIRHLVKRRVYFLLNSMSTRSKSVSYKEIRLRQKLADIHDKYVVVPADKASNNLVWGLMVSKIKLIKPPISLNRKYFLTTNQFFHHMVYHPQIRIMVFRYYIGYLNCTKFLINNP